MESSEFNPQENQENSLAEYPEIQAVVAEFKQKPEFKDVTSEDITLLIQKGIEIYKEEQYSYEGVLPHPSIIEGYEKFYPGVAKRIIEDSIDEAIHRRSLEQKMVNCEVSNTSRGMNYALIVVFMAISGACVSAYFESTVIGSIIGIGGLATLAFTFIQGKKK